MEEEVRGSRPRLAAARTANQPPAEERILVGRRQGDSFQLVTASIRGQVQRVPAQPDQRFVL